MVVGLDVFKEYFAEYPDQYVIIGGTACDIILGEAGFKARATKDIDIIIIVEALTPKFVQQFWKFIQDAKYERNEKSEGERQYYRFIKPETANFPHQIELFARNPDLVELEEGAHLTPIPVDDDLSSLSAILLDDDYYIYMIQQSSLEDGLHLANTEALICLKAKAYLEIKKRIEQGGKEDSKHLKKHKADVFRLAVTLTNDDIFVLPESIKKNLQAFVYEIADELPDEAIFKEMGLRGIEKNNVYAQILKSFELNG